MISKEFERIFLQGKLKSKINSKFYICTPAQTSTIPTVPFPVYLDIPGLRKEIHQRQTNRTNFFLLGKCAENQKEKKVAEKLFEQNKRKVF